MADWQERLDQSKTLKLLSWALALAILMLGSLVDPTGIALFVGFLLLLGLGSLLPTRGLAERFYSDLENDPERAARREALEEGIGLVFVFLLVAAASFLISVLRSNGIVAAPSFWILHPVFALVLALGAGLHTVWKLKRPITGKEKTRSDWEIRLGDSD